MTAKLGYVAAMLALTVGLPLAVQPIFAAAPDGFTAEQVNA